MIWIKEEYNMDQQFCTVEEALEELKNLIEKELSGTCEKYIVSAESPEIVISN